MQDEATRREQAEDELDRNVRSHEEEVKLRVLFEDKLNDLHSLYRENQLKQERAKQEYKDLAYQYETSLKQCANAQRLITELRAEIAESHSKIEDQDGKYLLIQKELTKVTSDYEELEDQRRELSQKYEIEKLKYERQ